jgi:hypothetical protein
MLEQISGCEMLCRPLKIEDIPLELNAESSLPEMYKLRRTSLNNPSQYPPTNFPSQEQYELAKNILNRGKMNTRLENGRPLVTHVLRTVFFASRSILPYSFTTAKSLDSSPNVAVRT